MKRLGVNIDHVATIRNARNSSHPDPVNIAKYVMEWAPHSITCFAILTGSGCEEPLAFLTVATWSILTPNLFILQIYFQVS